MDNNVTLLRPDQDDSQARAVPSSLPTDLLNQAAGRLRTLALLYAFVFFMAGIFPMLVVPNDRALLLSSFRQWGPSVLSITVALLVAAVIRSRRVSLASAMTIGLVFEVASSYGIAMAEFGDPQGMTEHSQVIMLHGLSWVAVWVILFTIVVPSPPRRALLAALASVSAVPVTVLLVTANGMPAMHFSRAQVFFWFVMPYLLVVSMAWVGARVVYALGAEVKRAREMGGYRLVEKLGQGGMGEVWRAHHRMLARPAAIKLMRPAPRPDERMSEDPVRRFEREAQVIAGLRSPHTVTLFDFGVADDGSFYYVMELLDGLDADRIVQRFGPVPAERAIFILRQMCHSLSEAESRGLVHRDIKPANIFLCRYGEDHDFVKVLDFGIVKALHDLPEQRHLRTAEDVIQGTPAFMAPEQSIDAASVDGRTDIYATGCVAYWLLTGKLVFEARSPVALLLQHGSAPPVPPSARTELPIPPALDQIVMACLSKRPSNRPQSARELSGRLEAVDCGRAWTKERAREWWDTHMR
jgi:serine/threonine-protein kinase